MKTSQLYTMFLTFKALLTALLVLMLIRESILCSVPKIRVKENGTMEYNVTEGKDIKLICWVQQLQLGKEVSVYWKKNNKTLQLAQHPRIRVRRFRYLKIKKARKKDTGFYSCVVENECGGKNRVDMKLFVRVESFTSDPNKTSTPAVPKFTVKKLKLTRVLLILPVGNSVKLDCSAEGYPRPTVKWYKDGALFLKRKGGSQVYLSPWTSVLVMKDLVPTDTGKYTCNVSNPYGWINHSYIVRVQERFRAKPVVLEMENVTAFVGENATLLCMVISDSMPHFQWLRWFTSQSNSSGNGTEVQNPHFEVVDQNKQDVVMQNKNSTFSKFGHKKKLTLVSVTKKDEGRYTCVVGNAHGYEAKEVYVIVQERTVQGDRNISQNLRNNSKITAIPPDGSTKSKNTPESKASAKEREKPGNKSSWTSGIRYPGVLIGVSVAVIIITITVGSWICWKMKKTRASSNSRRPAIDSLQVKFRVQNEYVIVPDFK